MFGSVPQLIAALGPAYIVSIAWPLAKTDVRELRLPNKLVLPALPITLASQLVAGILFGSWVNLGWAIGIAVCIFLGALALNRAGLLGMGDVKLMTVMALGLAWYSPLLPFIALIATFLFAGFVALALMVFRKLAKGSSMPLGPYLLAGFFSAITLAVWS